MYVCMYVRTYVRTYVCNYMYMYMAYVYVTIHIYNMYIYIYILYVSVCQCSLAHLQHPAANPKICDQTQEDPASLLFENVSQHFPLYGAVLCVLRSPSKTLAIEQRKASRTHEACETECIEIPTGLQQ